MLQERLQSELDNGRLYNSWLIESNNYKQTLQELESFVATILFKSKIPLNIHPDYLLIEPLESASSNKSINVEQIRELNQFLHKTSGAGNRRVAIINGADLMNLNAANNCLKVLEDTPRFSHIFMITSRISLILKTITSRCAKIICNDLSNQYAVQTYDNFIKLLASNELKPKLNLLDDIAKNKKILWIEFSNSILSFMMKVVKSSIKIEQDFSSYEIELANKLFIYKTSDLIKRFELMNQLISNTTNYDLDVKASCILLIEYLK